MTYHITYPSGRQFTREGTFTTTRFGTSPIPVPCVLVHGIVNALDPRAVITDDAGTVVFRGCTTEEMVADTHADRPEPEMTRSALDRLGAQLQACVICGGPPEFIGVWTTETLDQQIAVTIHNQQRRDVVDTPQGLAYALCVNHPPGNVTAEAVEAVLVPTWIPRGAGKSEMIH